MKKQLSKPIRYASYLRCSSDDQAHGDFTTIDTQRTMNRAAIDAKIAGDSLRGVASTFAGEWADEGKTGTNLRRAGWRGLIAASESKSVDVVVVTYMSRLARGKSYHVAEYLLSEQGVSVQTVQETFTPDMAGQMNQQVKVLADGLYPMQVSDWTRTKQASMVEMGYHTGGVCPYGFVSQPVPGMSAIILAGGKVKPPPKRLVPHETQAPHVVRAFEILAETGNLGNVQRYLREVEASRKWDMNAVRRLVDNVRYKGANAFGGKVNPAAHQAIVADALWDAAHTRLALAQASKTEAEKCDPRTLGYQKEIRQTAIPYYLRGRVFCEHCGGRMTPGGAWGANGKTGYYLCVQHSKHGKASGCPSPRINSGMLHEAVLHHIARAGKHPTYLNGLVKDAAKALPSVDDARENLAKLKRNARETERKIARLIDAIKTGNGTGVRFIADEIAVMEALLLKQQAAIAEAENQIAAGSARPPDAAAVGALWADFAENFAYLTTEEKTEILGLIVDSVTMQENRKGSLRLNLFTDFGQTPFAKLVNSYRLGARTGLEPVTFGL